MRKGIKIEVTTDDRARLEAIAADRNRRQKHAQRARIVLLTAAGGGTLSIMGQVGCAKATVWRWQERFAAAGVDGLRRNKSRPPAKAPLSKTVVERVVDLTLGEPPGAGTQWTGRAMAQAAGITQPGLPINKGKAGTMTFDYKRNGTTTLFAAFDVLEGRVIGQCMQRHRHQEFIRILNALERAVSAGRVVHVILDNYATHKHPKVLRWLSRHPRFVFHFMPTSSWLNAVETVFSRLARRRLKRGVFRSIVDLQAAINRYIEDHNGRAQALRLDRPSPT
jgi:transposase